MLLWMETKRCCSSFWYQNEEYKEDEWKKKTLLIWTQLQIEWKIRNLFIKLFNPSVCDRHWTRERGCFSKLHIAILGCVTHTEIWTEILQQSSFGSWGIASSVRNGCWPVRTSVWAAAKLLASVPLFWRLVKVSVKSTSFFLVICNCCSTFYVSVCQSFCY